MEDRIDANAEKRRPRRRRPVFAGLPPGTYSLSFDALHDGNDAVLIPGGLSYPVRGGDAQVTVSVASGGLETVNFG